MWNWCCSSARRSPSPPCWPAKPRSFTPALRPSSPATSPAPAPCLIAGSVNRFPYVLFVTDQIKRVEDLKGKKFGVSRIGSADNAAAHHRLDQLRPQRRRCRLPHSRLCAGALGGDADQRASSDAAASAGNSKSQRDRACKACSISPSSMSSGSKTASR